MATGEFILKLFDSKWFALAFVVVILGLFLGLFAIWMLRAPLTRLLDRVKSTKWFDSPPPESLPAAIQPEPAMDDTKRQAIEEYMQFGNSPAILLREKAIKRELQSKTLAVDGETVAVLIRQLAVEQTLRHCVETYGTIFGSQIALLKQLNVRGPMTRENMALWFDSVRARLPEPFKEWNMDRYLAFLFTREMIRLTETEGHYFITLMGVEFLTWLSRSGIDEHRAL